MKTDYEVIYADGRPTKYDSIEWPQEPGYDALKTLITPLLDGADLEHVNVLYEGKHVDMFVDEMGMLKKLPANDRASRIYHNASENRGVYNPYSIHGTAILFLRRVWY